MATGRPWIQRTRRCSSGQRPCRRPSPGKETLLRPPLAHLPPRRAAYRGKRGHPRGRTEGTTRRWNRTGERKEGRDEARVTWAEARGKVGVGRLLDQIFFCLFIIRYRKALYSVVITKTPSRCRLLFLSTVEVSKFYYNPSLVHQPSNIKCMSAASWSPGPTRATCLHLSLGKLAGVFRGSLG